jgi:hypothetical protein
MPHLVTDPNNLLLAAIAPGWVLLTAVMFDDESLRVGNLDEVVRMLLRSDSFEGSKHRQEIENCGHLREAPRARIVIGAVQAFLERRE